MSLHGGETIARWLNTPTKVKAFIGTLRNTGPYRKAAEKVGVNKNVVSGTVRRAGGLEKFLGRAGVDKPTEVAAEIRGRITTGERSHLEPRKPHKKQGSGISALVLKQEKAQRRDIAAQQYTARAERESRRRGVVTDPRVKTIANSLGSRGLNLIPGVRFDYGNALVKGKAVDTKNPVMQKFARIKLDQPSVTAPQSDVLAVSLKRDLESRHSAVGRAAKRSGIQRIAVAIQTPDGLYPVIDRTL